MSISENRELVPVISRKTFYEHQEAICDIPNVSVKDREDMVVCYGEYLTVGAVGLENSYPAFLQQYLRVEVRTEGHAEWLYTDAIEGLGRNVLDYNPRVVILQFGANDGWTRRPVGVVGKEVEELLKRCLDKGIITVLIGMAPPPSPDYFPLVAEYSKMYNGICTKLRIPLLDAECLVGGTFIPRLGIPEELKYEGQIPENSKFGFIYENSYNAEGNRALGANVFFCLRPLFEALGYLK